MKTYLAKYLPVEGKIKPPCIVLETLMSGKKELFQVDNLNDINEGQQVLAKLFLCSRDIQVGDKIRYFKNINTEFTASIWDTKESGGTESFKIIGEISHDAVWVKEGDEFDEDEVSSFGVVVGNPINGIQIKCPTCKYFH